MLSIRPFKECDSQYIASWIKDEYTLRQWGADRYPTFPVTTKDIAEHYYTMKDSDNFFGFTAYIEDTLVGHFTINFKDNLKRKARLGYIIINDKLRNKGYGNEMVNLAVKYAFEFLNIESLSLGVFESNKYAIKCYENCGFIPVISDTPMIYKFMDKEWQIQEMIIKNI